VAEVVEVAVLEILQAEVVALEVFNTSLTSLYLLFHIL
jgi:hypothetical protein